MRNSPNIAHYLVVFCDDMFKSRMEDSEMEKKLDVVIELFLYLDTKDIFVASYTYY